MRTFLSPACVLIASLLLALAGCGPNDGSKDNVAEGGIGGSGNGPGGGEHAEGGIGGSGSGTTTGYGSIYINDYRYYQIANDALVYLDNELVSPGTINSTGQGLPLGMVTEFLLDEDADAELTRGTVIAMEAHHRIIGPVTNATPLEVLGQPVRLSARTVLSQIIPDEVSTDDILQVAGLEDHIGTLRATRLAKPDSVSQWQLVGRISDLDATGFSIGSQRIDLTAVTPHQVCDKALSDGQKVLVRTQPQQDFSAGDALTGASLIRCLTEGLNTFGRDVGKTVAATTDGFITDIILFADDATPLTVVLGSQRVDLSQLVPVLVTTLANISLGTHLEVDGLLDTETGVLKAKRVRLRDELRVLELIAPITALSDGSLTVLGQPVIALPQAVGTLYDDLAVGQTVRLLGFVNDTVNDTTLYAVSATVATSESVSLRGAVTAVDEAGGQLLIAGIPFLFASADSFSLLGEDGLLVELVTGVCQTLLPLLCPSTEQPPTLNAALIDTVADLRNSSLNNTILEGGDLLIYPANP